MTVIAALAAVAITPTEEQTVNAVTPFEDASGMVTSVLASLQESKAQLTYLNGNMPAGSNKTAIAAVIAALA